MVKEAEVTQKKWLTSPRLFHIVGNPPLTLTKNTVHLAAAVLHRRQFAAEVSEQKSDTCVAVHAVKVRGTASHFGRRISRAAATVGNGFACRGRALQ